MQKTLKSSQAHFPNITKIVSYPMHEIASGPKIYIRTIKINTPKKWLYLSCVSCYKRSLIISQTEVCTINYYGACEIARAFHVSKVYYNFYQKHVKQTQKENAYVLNNKTYALWCHFLHCGCLHCFSEFKQSLNH